MWKLDRILAVIGVLVGRILTSYLETRYHSVVYAAIGVLSTLACAGYLLLTRNTRVFSRPHPSVLPDVAYWVLFISSLVVYFLRPDISSRPLSYFILTALACGALAAKIMTQQCGKIVIAQIIMVGLSVDGTVTAMFPSLIGLDPYWHRYLAMQILGGHNFGVSALPGMSYWVAGIMYVTGLIYKAAAFLGVTVLQIVVDIVLIFNIGSMVSGRRVGLLAALILVTANWHIFFGIWPIPNTFAATMLLACIWLVVKWHKTGIIWWLLPSPFLLAAITVTHAMVTVWAALALSAYIGVIVVCNVRGWWKRDKVKKIIPIAAVLTIFIVGGYLAWKSMGFADTAQNIIYNISNPTQLGFSGPPGTPPTTVPVVTSLSTETLSAYPWELLLNSSGMFLLFAGAIFGALLMIRRRRSGELYVGVLGIGYLVGGFLPILFSMALLQERWWYMAEIMLVIPAALAIKEIALRTSLPAVIIGVGGLAFLGMIGLPSNIDNRSISHNQIIRYVLTDDELSIMKTVMENSEGVVGVDRYYTVALHYLPQYRKRMKDITDSLVSGNIEGITARTVIIREEVRNQAIGFGEGVIYKLNYDPVVGLQDMGYKTIYRNRDAVALSLD